MFLINDALNIHQMHLASNHKEVNLRTRRTPLSEAVGL